MCKLNAEISADSLIRTCTRPPVSNKVEANRVLFFCDFHAYGEEGAYGQSTHTRLEKGQAGSRAGLEAAATAADNKGGEANRQAAARAAADTGRAAPGLLGPGRNRGNNYKSTAGPGPESKTQPRSWAAAQRGGGTVSVRAGAVHKMGSERSQVRANRAKIQGGFTSLQQELGAIDRQLRERTRCARVAGAARHWLSSSASGPLAEAAWEVTGGSRQLHGSCCPIIHSTGY